MRSGEAGTQTSAHMWCWHSQADSWPVKPSHWPLKSLLLSLAYYIYLFLFERQKDWSSMYWSSMYWFAPQIPTPFRLGPGGSLESAVLSRPLMWEAGTQNLEPSRSSLQNCISRRLDQKQSQGLNPGTLLEAAGVLGGVLTTAPNTDPYFRIRFILVTVFFQCIYKWVGIVHLLHRLISIVVTGLFLSSCYIIILS